MTKLNNKGIVQIFVIFILLLGLLSGLYLIQHTQIFKPKAASIESSASKSVKAEDEVKEKTLSLFELNKEYIGASSDEKPQVQENLANKVKERKQAVLSLIEENPAAFLRIALPSSIRDQFSDELKGDIEEEVTLEGKLEVLHTDNFEQKTSKNHFSLVTDNTEHISLYFADRQPEYVSSGAKVKLRGVKMENKMAIESTNIDTFQILIQPANVLGGGQATTKKVAVILVNFADNPNQPFTQEQARQVVFTNSDSVSAYFKEVSFDTINLVGKLRSDGDVFGWYTIPSSTAPPSIRNQCDFSNWMVVADNLARTAGVYLTGYDQSIYIFQAEYCGGGLAYGSSISSTSGNLDFLQREVRSILIHELGHNFGSGHANSYHCYDANENRVTVSSVCRIQYEYGDPFDVMGGGQGSTPRHLNNFHKNQTNIPVVMQEVTSNGIYTITPIEYLSSGPQGIFIPRDRLPSGEVSTYYALEYRQPYGLFDTFNSTDPVVNGVSIRLSSPISWQYINSISSPPTSDLTWADTVLYDTTPLTPSYDDAPLTAEREFYDPVFNITIKTLSVDSQKASVQVTFGSPTCTRANPEVSISPSSTSGIYGNAGETLSYSVTILNKDSNSCSPSVFSVVPTFLVAGWSQFPNPHSILLAPGVSANAVINITSPAGATLGYHTFTETVTNTSDPTFFAAANADYSITSQSSFMPPNCSACSADKDKNGVVDIGDLQSIIDINDFMCMVSKFGQSCER